MLRVPRPWPDRIPKIWSAQRVKIKGIRPIHFSNSLTNRIHKENSTDLGSGPGPHLSRTLRFTWILFVTSFASASKTRTSHPGPTQGRDCRSPCRVALMTLHCCCSGSKLIVPSVLASQGAPQQLKIPKWPFAKLSACSRSRRKRADLLAPVCEQVHTYDGV